MSCGCACVWFLCYALATTGNKEKRDNSTTYTDDQLRETVEFKQASKPFGTGGAIQQAITASTAAIQGLAGGDIAKALAGASAPYLAEVIHRQTTSADGEVNIPANLMAHAVVNAALSLAKGENALAGASSAVTAEAVGLISEAYYDKKPSELDEKQKVSASASLAAGLAGGLVGGDTASAVSGMQTGKVTVENNYLSDKDIKTFTEKYTAAKTDSEKEQLLADLKKQDAEKQRQALSTGISIADQKLALADLKALAASSECTAQCQELAAYSISELEPVANNTQLHENNLKKGILASVIIALTVDKPVSNNSAPGLSSLTKEQQQLINNAEYITTAKGIQNPFPRDLNEKVLWNGVKANPSAGEVLKGMNKDPRFPVSAGFQKMQVTHELPDGSNITIHYQYNSNTGKAYDMKMVTPQANPLQPGPSLKGK
ncbi:VENN motif pre-toxin domain-containing protein [Rosenbergiella epipactidis]|uniref:VENN motif pre-toxin domain-containing protein n=1 Tax=Rosenbergiella epipactidis TaxID=1544694 RepID=UPI001FD57AEF|nr:VENN motif pre-toxin domain-containing protein [Rosenbergiella epipactidis]